MGRLATAMVFPGQGSQHGSMREIAEAHVPELTEAVRGMVGGDPFDRLDRGTRWVQPAVFLASMGGWRSSQPQAHVVAMAGHSLGELAALAAAGALTPNGAAELVVRRAIITEEVAREVGGGMIALLGLELAAAAALADEWELHVANENCPGQVVLSGRADTLDRACREADRREITYRRLPVEGPFHSPLMAPAVATFEEAVGSMAFQDPAVPIVSCISGSVFEDPRRELVAALTSPVRWQQTVTTLADMGVERFEEVPPGRVLCGLVRRILRGRGPTLVALDTHA